MQTRPINFFQSLFLLLLCLVFSCALLFFLSACSSLLPFFDAEHLNSSSSNNLFPAETSASETDASDSNPPSAANPESEQNTSCSGAPEPVAELPYIGIYSGAGSWDLNVEAFKRFFDYYDIKWTEFDEKQALDLNELEMFDLLWFPGGFSAEYKYNIQDHSAIRAFVEKGGLFAGTCAGAYYAAETMRWFGTDSPYPLGFFAGTAQGPLSGLVGWGEQTTLKLNEQLAFEGNFTPGLTVYYFDGPCFLPQEPQDIIILATYQVNEKPAVVAGTFGHGKYLLFGPHPELGGYNSNNEGFNLDGDGGAQWPWLYAALLWLINW